MKKRKDGRYEKVVTVNGVRKSVYGKTMREVREKSEKLRKKMEQGLKMSDTVTLDEYFEIWYERQRGTVKDATMYGYRTRYARLSRHAGSIKVRDFTPAVCSQIQDKLKTDSKFYKGKETGRPYSTGSINATMQLLSMILKEAARERIILENPLTGQRTLRMRDEEHQARDTIHAPLSDDELASFLKYAEGSYYEHFFRFMLATGMRAGEVAALTPSDIDTDKFVVHVHRTITRDEHNHVTLSEAPKTSAGRRDIPFTPELITLVNAQKEQNRKMLPDSTSIFLFPAKSGGAARPNNVDSAMAVVLRKMSSDGISISRRTSHALRATRATRWAKAGVRPEVLRKLMGHTSIQVTYTYYVGVDNETAAQEIRKASFI